MEHEAHEELEEDELPKTEPNERQSLSERLMGVTTMDEVVSPYSSTSARGLIEKLTSGGTLASSEKRPPADAKRTLKNLRKKSGLAARLRIDIPANLRARDDYVQPEELTPKTPAPSRPRLEPSSVSEETPAMQKAPSEPQSFPRVIESQGEAELEKAAAANSEPIAPKIEESPSAIAATDQLLSGEAPALKKEAQVTAESPVREEVAPPAETSDSENRAAAGLDQARPELPPLASDAGQQAASIAAVGSLRRAAPAGSGHLERLLEEANRFSRLRYNLLLSSIMFVFGLAFGAGVALVAVLAADAAWQIVAITGGLEALAVLSLIALLYFLQHEPSIRAAPSSTEMAQLETGREYLNKSFEFWEKYLRERQDGSPVTAEDVAMAVSSLTAASHSLLDLEAGLAKLATQPKETIREPQTSGPTSPTRPPSVRTRPSRY